ncbi:helix-turn-helix domain-containing protein [Pantoea sp. Cy-640]|jgi:DNA-binding XRE family transcriptional regulator|uniref:helix-turn-helix domain-containing protein n=1 Tax=Pantoea sp. Cy-640 TaxID=2608353 RepID=UPI001419A842|nr:helix-turn-helix transcriptional regulator [Pantoea sp. Cy-640]NIG12468.1 helix-turn-helix transcriptional regulator [Pantoea sp. Cy-640]
MSKQYIYDEAGKPQFVVLPVAEYEKLLSDAESSWTTLAIEADEHDDETVPHDVVGIMLSQDISLQAAWRVYRNLSQQYVAEQLGTTQSAISQLERKESKPQKKTRERLARLYGCRAEQLLL